MTTPLWWLSFADADGFRGVAIVRADSFLLAPLAARLRGCNPGGQVLGVEIAPDLEVPAPYVDRLLNREECDELQTEFERQRVP